MTPRHPSTAINRQKRVSVREIACRGVVRAPAAPRLNAREHAKQSLDLPLVADGQIVAKESVYSVPGKGERMSRADVAGFLLKTAEEKSYEKKVVAIAV